jgi:hypothetical protein
VPIRPYLEGHTVRTAAQQGWDRPRNGDLLTAAEDAGFDLFLTASSFLSGGAAPSISVREFSNIVRRINASSGRRSNPMLVDGGPSRRIGDLRHGLGHVGGPAHERE